MIPAAVIATARRRGSGGGGDPGGSLSVAHVAGGVVGGTGEKVVSGIDFGPAAWGRTVVVTFEMEAAAAALSVSDVKVGDLILERVRNLSVSGSIDGKPSSQGAIELWETDLHDFVPQTTTLKFTPSSSGQTTRYDAYVLVHAERVDADIAAANSVGTVGITVGTEADGVLVATAKISDGVGDPLPAIAAPLRDISYAGAQMTTHRMKTGSLATTGAPVTLTVPATTPLHHKSVVAATYRQAQGGEVTPRPSPIRNGLVYHFESAVDAYADPAGTTLAVDALSVGRWGNRVAGDDAVQNTPERRPTFRTGGLAGKPYIECDRSVIQHFEDLPFVQPSGITSSNLYTPVIVVDAVDVATLPAPLMGSNKNHFRITTANQLRMVKTQFVAGATVNPMVAIGRFTLSNVTFNINGTTSSLGSSSNLPSGGETVMQFLRDGTDHFHGRLYEFLLFNRRLADSEVAFLMSYLKSKYGIA